MTLACRRTDFSYLKKNTSKVQKEKIGRLKVDAVSCSAAILIPASITIDFS